MLTARPSAAPLPGPPGLLPGLPDAIVDLQTDGGCALVGAQWRWSEVTVQQIESRAVGDDLGPSGPPTLTYDISPHAEAADYDDRRWERLAPADTQRRLAGGRVCFAWYRMDVTLPERVGDLDVDGATVVFEVVVDDYAEVWVDGHLPLALGARGGGVVAGFNTPNRVILTDNARPGQRFQLAVFGANGPISASPANFVWIRSATLDLYRPGRSVAAREVPVRVMARDPRFADAVPPVVRLEQVAAGFEFTEGPLWSPDGTLLFSEPNANVIYRWRPRGEVEVFRAKAGYAGVDIGRYTQPGSNGLAWDDRGRLLICQHGLRRVLRVEPRGNTTVVANRYLGRRLNSPNDLVCRRDGTIFFTDPTFGLPDPDEAELASGVYAVVDGEVRLLTDELAGPNGIALSPDETALYVANWDPANSVVLRWDLAGDGTIANQETFAVLPFSSAGDGIDGLTTDASGNVYVCGPDALEVFAPDGAHLGSVTGPEHIHNCCWGDPDGRTLYLTARTGVYRLVPQGAPR
jgi:gluconolactonase